MADRKFRKARIWSNKILQKYAETFKGEVVNVSAWEDMDKSGKKYKDYFVNASKYYLTNYGGYRGISENGQEILLDLTNELPIDLNERFDVVFNHTTLEHTFDIGMAFKNLCSMAKDAVIIVVPFAQIQHTGECYDDYWRFTPFSIEKLFKKNDFVLVVCEYNSHFNSAVYLFCIGIRANKLEMYRNFKACNVKKLKPPGNWIGFGFNDLYRDIRYFIKNIWSR